jgi:hypothetical protein
MAAPKKPPWKKPRPTGTKATKLSEADKAAARARAQRAGRRYPNLVDNMWAAQRQKPKSKSKPKPKG